jgi:hypothetical protein
VGIRQALARKGTVLVACKGTKLPFDLRNQRIENYDYFSALGVAEFISQLRSVIENAVVQDIVSPVHALIPKLFVRTYEVGKEPDVAAAVLGNNETSLTAYRNALKLNPPVEHARSELEQLEFLRERNFAAERLQNVLPILREYVNS